MVSVTVVTYNIGDGPDERKRDDLLRLLEAGARVICLQEAGDRREVLEGFCAEVGWVLWRGFAAGSPSVPIVHDGQALIEARSSRLVVPSTLVGAGAGPSVAKAKAITAINIEGVRVLNTHMVASATRRDASHLRREHYGRHVAALAKRCRRQIELGHPIVAVGDFNATPDFKMLDPLRLIGMEQQTQERTRDRRIIDQMWTSGLTVTDRQVLELSSDHKAAMATVTVPD